MHFFLSHRAAQHLLYESRKELINDCVNIILIYIVWHIHRHLLMKQ